MPEQLKINKSAIQGKDSLDAYHNLVKNGVISHDSAQEKVAVLLKKLAEKLNDYSPKKTLTGKIKGLKKLGKQGIYIYGDVGRGKSMLMDLLYNTTSFKSKRRVHFHAFMLEVHSKIHNYRQKKDKKDSDPIPHVAKKIAKDSMLLCFDEFQVHDVTDAMILSRLFTEFFKQGVIVVATSNVKPDKLYENGLQRQQFLPFIDLLKEKTDIVSLDSPNDYRLKKLKSVHNLYFSPLGEEAENFTQKIFADLTNNAVPERAEIDINGRKLILEETYADTAITSFSELCDKPLGAADYIELARNFSTLIITGIPKMGKDQRNQAKRFTTLIDELYEHKVKLICTAEVEPQKIYTSGDNSFEFARTVSRLYEMQSEDYLKLQHIS